VNGAVVGVSVFGKDLTECKVADQFADAGERRFRTLIEQAPCAVTIGRHGMNLYVNRTPKFMGEKGQRSQASMLLPKRRDGL
jgi:hypothetical protein